jgi:hypothetical protein
MLATQICLIKSKFQSGRDDSGQFGVVFETRFEKAGFSFLEGTTLPKL